MSPTGPAGPHDGPQLRAVFVYGPIRRDGVEVSDYIEVRITD